MDHLLKQSIQNRQKLELVYIDEQHRMTQRIVTIIKIDDDRLLAYCFTKRGVRSFQKDNILAIYPARFNQSKRMEA
ncbi:putative DNA-binding transcriptional regulator YafY [Alkalibacillus flavidus]|uniref:DNA-binding transcriptional regulator YafY n=1 Tax=Alkalibacillus flavidus TaxID=546021 RepID=A0ABV2KRM5_9BACI